MKSLWGQSVVFTCIAATLMGGMPSSVLAGNPFRKSTSVEKLAKTLDRVERQLQWSGRVTAKAPDVWGQSRLTKHREEFEGVLSTQLAKAETLVKDSIQGQLTVSDQAFLEQLVTLRAGIGFPTPPRVVAISGSTNTTLSRSLTTTQQDPITAPAATETLTIQQLALIPQNGSRELGGFTRSAPFNGFGQDGPFPQDKITVEPEVFLDQLKRYVDHLHAIRRNNEGDDTADSPGYSLNLVRIPVSVIPGDKTREGWGAEMTVTAEAVVTDELLEPTFRELVVNDLVDQLALPIVKMIELNVSDLSKIESIVGESEIALSLIQDTESPDKATVERALSQLALPKRFTYLEINVDDIPGTKNRIEQEKNYAADQMKQAIRSSKNIALEGLPRERHARYPLAASEMPSIIGEDELFLLTFNVFKSRDKFACRGVVSLPDVQAFLKQELEAAYEFLSTTTPGFTATAEVCEVPLWMSPHLPAAKSLRRPVAAAESRRSFFQALSVNTTNGGAPNSGDDHSVTDHRSPLYRSDDDGKVVHSRHAETMTEALAWAVLVESVLLNERLNEDIQHTAQDPNCNCIVGQEFQFYGPTPPPEAKRAFAEYVKCRWPVRVFALDPEAQQQNIAEASSLRREMQLAIALAFSTGRVNANSLTRFVRRLEQDLRTISLNNTVVGFGAGNDTFGWRFFPRFQAPQVEGNLTVGFRELLGGDISKDAQMSRWRIDPGPRECTALVLMPSFVHHVRFDTRGSWFRLVPKKGHKLLHIGDVESSLAEGVEWGKELKSVENGVYTCVHDEHLHRDGDVERLMRRAKQVSQLLPLNTFHSQVPSDNTLGGFEMFNSGVTDLAPELIGFYGAPGYKAGEETTVFLVGKNFSLHRTKVLAGNVTLNPDGPVTPQAPPSQPPSSQPAPSQTPTVSMLSRQVLQITIPKTARIDKRRCTPQEKAERCPNVCECDDEYVEVRVATPYGVSSQLHIPVVKDCKPPAVAPLSVKFEAEDAGFNYQTACDPSGCPCGPISSAAVPAAFNLVVENAPLDTDVVVRITKIDGNPTRKTVFTGKATVEKGKATVLLVGQDPAFVNALQSRVTSDWLFHNEDLPANETFAVELVAEASSGEAKAQSEPVTVEVTFLPCCRRVAKSEPAGAVRNVKFVENKQAKSNVQKVSNTDGQSDHSSRWKTAQPLPNPPRSRRIETPSAPPRLVLPDEFEAPSDEEAQFNP